VSASLLKTTAEFRKNLNKKLPTSHRLVNPKERIDASEFGVVFAVILTGRKDGWELPVFSKITLSEVSKQLFGLGFPVSVEVIKGNLKPKAPVS
jgi:uncharacterized protein (TIGR04141 family)